MIRAFQQRRAVLQGLIADGSYGNFRAVRQFLFVPQSAHGVFHAHDFVIVSRENRNFLIGGGDGKQLIFIFHKRDGLFRNFPFQGVMFSGTNGRERIGDAGFQLRAVIGVQQTVPRFQP